MEKENQISPETPTTVLQVLASQIWETSGGVCFGVVTESFNDETEEYYLALQLVTPKLKNYSYRLIEVKCKNIINPFPATVSLFAKHPSNNDTKSCSDIPTLKVVLQGFMASPIPKMIMNHLGTLGSIAEEYSQKDQSATITSESKKTSIVVDNPSRPLVFKRIVLTSHFDKPSSEWLPIVLNTQIKISCTGLISGGVVSNTISLIAHVSPNHTKPIFDMDFIFPSNADLIQFSARLTNKLIYFIELVSEVPNIQLSIVYDKNTLEAR